MKKSITFLLIFLLCGFQLFAQQTVSGTVTDANDGTPLIGATVMITGTTSGTITDINGKYTMSIPAGAVLTFSYVGYVPQEIEVGNRTKIDIALGKSTTELEELVVIGYGSRQRRDVTSAISTVTSEDLVKTNSISPELAMQGRMSGVYVQSSGSEPFSRPTVRVRGTNTWGIADPLYVIDGVPITEYGSGAEAVYGASGMAAGAIQDLRSPINIMTMINPNDIESISILKDATAAAIYGVRAANGVILITTKKGKVGKPTVEFNFKYGIQNIPKTYEVLNVDQYVALYNEAYANNPAETMNKPSVFDPASPDYLGDYPTIDWQTPFLNKNAPIQDYNLKISGGTENTNYYVSVSYNDTESPFINSWQKRYGLATNINTNVTKFLRTGVNYRLIYSDILDESNDQWGGGSLQEFGISIPPWQPIYNPNARIEQQGYMEAVNYWYEPDGTFSSIRKWGPAGGSNQFGMMALGDKTYSLLRNIGTAYVELEPIKGLKLRGSMSIDWYYNRTNEWTDIWNFVFSITPGDPLSLGVDGEDDTIGSYGERHTRNTNLVSELTANYTKSFGDHNLDLLFNFMDQQYQWEVILGGTDQIPMKAEDFYPMSLSANEYSNVQNSKDHYALQGYLGRLGYNYANRYYLDATIRRDGSSRFAPENRWGTFPSISAAWRISSESFMQNLSWLTDLKIRGGWGQLGNQETASFAYLSLISRAPHYAYGSTAAFGDPRGIYALGGSLTNYTNPDLTWEKTSTTNIGFDANLFTALDLSIEYYYKFTDGVLQDYGLPASVGAQQMPVANIAQVKNQGVELSLGYRGSIGDLKYYINGNLTTVKNEVVKMYEDTPLGDEYGRIEVGHPINYLWAYKMGGVFKDQQAVTDYQAATDDANATRQEPGDCWFEDVNGPPDEDHPFYTEGSDSVVNNYDRTYVGKTIPGFFYGFSFNLEYKGFDLSAFFQGVGDIQAYNNGKWAGENMSSQGNNQLTTVLDRWTPTNTNADIPRAIYADPAENTRVSDRWIENAGYFRFANLQLGYTVPTSAANRLGVFQNLRVWVGGSNLFMITPWTGLDPESDVVPTPRVFNMGVDVRF
jgi:TonB-dependent starch-binding outer membrane protein SusC